MIANPESKAKGKLNMKLKLVAVLAVGTALLFVAAFRFVQWKPTRRRRPFEGQLSL